MHTLKYTIMYSHIHIHVCVYMRHQLTFFFTSLFFFFGWFPIFRETKMLNLIAAVVSYMYSSAWIFPVQLKYLYICILNMYIYVYISICILYTCMHIRVHPRGIVQNQIVCYICIYTYTYVYTHIHMYIYIYICIYTYTYVHIYMYMYLYSFEWFFSKWDNLKMFLGWICDVTINSFVLAWGGYD